jgi:RNA polymerase sigma-B factor
MRPTDEEQRALFDAYWTSGRDRAARDRIVERYAFVADHHALRFRRAGIEVDDLRQLGLLAIMRAVPRFDPTKGASFATFADRTVEGECKRYLRDRSWMIRPPRRLHDAHLRVRSAADELLGRLHRSPTIPELAAELGWDEESVLEALEVAEVRRGVEVEARGSEGPPLLEPAVEDHEMERATENLWLKAAMDRVDPQTRQLLVHRYYLGRSQDDLAQEFGVSQSYMSRMLRAAVARLREAGERGSGSAVREAGSAVVGR